MNTTNKPLNQWVEEVVQLTKPKKIHWCTGSKEEYQSLAQQMVESKQLIKLNEDTYPNCYLHRSNPNDVARTEHLTFVCTKDKNDAGPNNNWMPPNEAHQKTNKLFAGCMQGRTMYVIPYCMGPLDSSYSRCGVEITDSPYVVINMNIMTRMGEKALNKISKGAPFVKGLHSTGDLSIDKRMIAHFPEEQTIKSFSSGYGGNALLGKKCHALRIASWQAKQEGWLAEHMLIVGIENPQGEKTYVAAAFPSACGKTNLAMLIPPETYKGWKVWTVGDDISWMSLGEDGRLYAINPEAGFFGVVPGTSQSTNPNALKMIQQNTIFTNVALTKNNEPWWEGKGENTPAIDWKGQNYTATNGPSAHPNSRFTTPMTECPSYSSAAEYPQGVPISAIIFGGRRPSLIPLVREAENWTQGVLMGACASSQTTAAATGKVGVLRNDPMAMKPFCGYHFGDYWKHWLSFQTKSTNLPKIFYVNWFRKDENDQYMWPGFGENIRVLEWMIKRTKRQITAEQTPIGNIPNTKDLNTSELNISEETMKELCNLSPEGWQEEFSAMENYLTQFHPRVPDEFLKEISNIKKKLGQ
jgi:phosphoenolpyruvate carboxykinase (GTP)